MIEIFMLFYSITRSKEDIENRTIMVGISLGLTIEFIFLGCFFICLGAFTEVIEKKFWHYLVFIGVFLGTVFCSVFYYFKNDYHIELIYKYQALPPYIKTRNRIFSILILTFSFLFGTLIGPLIAGNI